MIYYRILHDKTPYTLYSAKSIFMLKSSMLVYELQSLLADIFKTKTV